MQIAIVRLGGCALVAYTLSACAPLYEQERYGWVERR
jgi:hypothetical protein